ncbi:MAG: hypothetical protein OEU76_09245 [Cyclobacteriaceae bacterium]|nr:hypothetical protein [Cyclobacteriaceae bacterium]
MFKFIFGPIAGYGAGLHLVTTILVTILGMMTSVVAFTFFGNWLRKKVLTRWIRNRKKFNPGNRRAVRIRTTFGLVGIALLTPLILTPIGGTLLAVSLGASKERILLYMLISASVFAILFSVAIYSFGDSVLPDFIRPDFK